MPKTCIVCKKFSISGDTSRSFHKFPSESVLRQKWLSAINLTTVPKTATICSEHFTKDAFHESNSYASKRYLLPNAVPIINRHEEENVLCEETTLYVKESTDTATRSSVQSSCHHSVQSDSHLHVSNGADTDLYISNGLYGNNDENIKCEEKNVNSGELCITQSHPSVPSPCDGSVQSDSDLHISDHYVSAKPTVDGDEFLTATSSTTSHVNRSRKRQSIVDDAAVPIKRIRFKDGFQTKYLSRENFVSDDAWNLFLRFHTCKSNQIDAMRKRSERVQRKLNNLNDLVKVLREKNERSAAEFLEVIY